MCECGHTRQQHLEEATRPHTLQGKDWDPKKHVQEMPTDAFGDIVFKGLGQKVGKVGLPPSVVLTVDSCQPSVIRGGQDVPVWERGGLKPEASSLPALGEGLVGAPQGSQETHGAL